MQIARVLLAALFVAAGVSHFLWPGVYVAIVPPMFLGREALVYISGVAEFLGGVGLMFEATRRVAAIGLIALLVAVFPANIYAALHGMELAGRAVPAWLLWARLPIQPLLIGAVWLVAKSCFATRDSSRDAPPR